ncbi:Uncharacterised protein [Bordetella pertussis]|nr:Uncharacterised protein [Bordetella pertussis]
MDFVEQLLDDGGLVDQAARAIGFADDAMAVLVDLGDWEADLLQPGHVLVAGVGVVAAADLRAAFEQMPGHGGAPDAVPVVGLPAEIGHRGAHRQRRVRHAAAHHDFRAMVQRVANLFASQIGIGADDAGGIVLLAQVLGQHAGMLRAGDIVALDHRDARLAQAQPRGHAQDMARRAFRIGGPEVADDAYAVRQAARQHRSEHVLEQRLVPRLGIGALAQLRKRQGAFGQGLENQEGSAVGGNAAQAGDQRIDHRAGGVDTVAREACGAADQQGRE